MTCITVIINTYNEERRLPYAIRSVKSWAQEVVVVDMFSTDRTAQVARSLGAQVIQHGGSLTPPREFAVEQGSGEWIFVLDADEVVPLSLSCELQHLASREFDVVLISRINYFFGVPLLHGGVEPEVDVIPRLFRRGHVIASSQVHRDFSIAPGARVVRIPYRPGWAIVHFTYTNTESFIAKLNRYTTKEALESRAVGTRTTAPRMCYHALKEFYWRYLKHGGYRDGWRGLYLALLYCFYRVVSFAKSKELETIGTGEDVEGLYREIAEQLVREYECAEAAVARPVYLAKV